MKNATVIKFTKIKSYFFPVDADDYKLLRHHGIPAIKIHENLMPTLGLLFARHSLRPQLISFMDAILNPYLDRVGTVWQRKEHRKATIHKTWMKFETTHASIQSESREALHKLEASLRNFFTRWGYLAVYEVSESRGKLKLHVSYRFDPEACAPIVPLAENPTSLPTIRLDLGFVRLSVTQMKKEVEINVAVAAGTGWNSIHTSRCLYSQISDVRPMLATLVAFVGKDQHNADNKAR